MYQKVVSKRELEFTRKAADLGVAPQILRVEKVPTRGPKETFRIFTERYDMTLEEYHDRGGNVEIFGEEVEKLVHRLHGAGILHGDLHANNIVCKGLEVKLIDFGSSYHFREIDRNVLNELERFLEKDFPGVEAVKGWEREMWKQRL